MIVNKGSFLRLVALAVMLTGTTGQLARAEDPVTQHGSESGNCARSAFRVLIDVGHTATSPGADSARGVPEYEFNLKLADVIAQSLHEAGFDKTIRLVTSGSRLGSLFQRAASANSLQGDLFVSIHHDSVPDNLKETWQYEGKKLSYSDRFSGYAIFVSNDNADRAASLAFGHSLGQELQKRGLRYTPHYTLPLMGRYRHELIDGEAGVYRYDHLIVLHTAHMPAVRQARKSFSGKSAFPSQRGQHHRPHSIGRVRRRSQRRSKPLLPNIEQSFYALNIKTLGQKIL